MPPRLHVISIHPELSPDNELEIKLIVAGDTREHALDLVSKMEAFATFPRHLHRRGKRRYQQYRGHRAVPHQRAVRAGELEAPGLGGAQ